MTIQGIHKIHKWLAVPVGAFFLGWLVSGVVMIAPRFSPDPEGFPIPEPIDTEKTIVSVKEAVAALERIVKDVAGVKTVTLKKIANANVYEIITARGDVHLIDAESGARFDITPQRAEAIAMWQTSRSRALSVEHLSRHDFTYPLGPLPVYRVRFEQDQSILYYVSARDGSVHRSDRESRIRNAIASVHGLDPVKLLIESEAFRKTLLILLSLLGTAAVCTGYVIALKRRP